VCVRILHHCFIQHKMKAENKSGPDKVEKELKSLIDKLNSENAALTKILSLVGLNESDRITETPAEEKQKKP
jgi:hypothetical protein